MLHNFYNTLKQHSIVLKDFFSHDYKSPHRCQHIKSPELDRFIILLLPPYKGLHIKYSANWGPLSSNFTLYLIKKQRIHLAEHCIGNSRIVFGSAPTHVEWATQPSDRTVERRVVTVFYTHVTEWLVFANWRLITAVANTHCIKAIIVILSHVQGWDGFYTYKHILV